MSYILAHTRLGFCLWDIPAVIILVAIIVFFIVKAKKMKEEQEELEDQIAKLYADDSMADVADGVTE